MGDADSVRVGRVTRDGSLVGFLVVDDQHWDCKQRRGWRIERWSEERRRLRLDLLTDWCEDFLSPEEEVALSAGRFCFKGEVLAYEELHGDERSAVLADHFSNWE
ncbi:MAG: hypothetical protein QOC93_1348 [Actinomycetota bacterium]|jgi:hypothetical protein|nr:hypothetical protein [Actinomycetota bacterium]